MPESDQPQDESFGSLLGDDVEPLRDKGAVHVAQKRQVTPGMLARRKAAADEAPREGNYLDPVSAVKQLSPYDFLEFCRPGVQQGVYRNLRLGKYNIETRLDLHGHTVEQARQAMWEFVRDCQQQSVRCALVTHGKGEHRAQPAVLKSCVNHWLQQIPDVLAFHSAQKQHGGTGATYLLVRKSQDSRRKTSDALEKSRRFRR